MLRKYLLTPLFETPNTGSAGGTSSTGSAGTGTTGNVAAPASSGSSASSSGASSGSSGNISSGTASEALIKAAMASSSEAAGTGTGTAGDTSGVTGAVAPGAAGAVVQPPTTGQAATTAATTGGAPDNRIQTAVRNARAAVLQQFGLDPNMDTRSPEFQGRVQSMQRAMRLAEHLSTPEGLRSFYNRMRTELEGARSEGSQGDPNENLALPEADLQSQDGRVKAYSAEAFQKALDINAKIVQRNVMKQLQPVLDEVNGIRQGRESREQMERTSATLKRASTHARTLPHFQENEKHVVVALQSMDPQLKRELGPVAAMYMAYGQVLAKSVFPTLESNVEKRIRETYQREANANRGQVVPGANTGAVGAKVELSGPESLAKHMEKLAATMQ